jgi:hypothetical protein
VVSTPAASALHAPAPDKPHERRGWDSKIAAYPEVFKLSLSAPLFYIWQFLSLPGGTLDTASLGTEIQKLHFQERYD